MYLQYAARNFKKCKIKYNCGSLSFAVKLTNCLYNTMQYVQNLCNLLNIHFFILLIYSISSKKDKINELYAQIKYY